MRVLLLSMVLPSLVSVSVSTGYGTDYDDYDSTESLTTPTVQRDTRTTRKRAKTIPKQDYVADIEKFLDTNETIWVYQSTERTTNTCMVDAVEYAYYFGAGMTRYHVSNGSRYEKTGEARFDYHFMFEDHSLPYNEMTFEDQGLRAPFETVVYQTKDNQCAVFYMNFHREFTDPTTWIEVRVRNSSLEKGPDRECLERFNSYAHGQNITYNYTSECQCLFRQETH
uniref:Putative group i salivary lipocalin n=1 Tax=Rhipicephalus pulchellus TaxID=72859 RepID=L7LTG2_RHIPC